METRRARPAGRAGGDSAEGPLSAEGRRRGDTGYGRQVDRATSREMTRRDESGFWFRPESPAKGAPSETEGGDDWENHLAPYRREVNRLRAMLQNWRQTTDRGERAEADGGEGKGE